MVTRREFAALPLAAAAGAQKRPRTWTIFVIQHSHIDIGYTEKQEVIAEFHRQFISQAVRFAVSPAQRDRDPNCRFKFTCEGFWQVEQFWAHATAAERRNFIRAVHEGVMELTSSYLHFTELPDQEMLRHSVSYAAAFARREGIPLTAAMECDINGLSWGMADAQTEVGVRYLSMNVNNYHGGYPFGRPMVPFWWESPSGRRLLVWNGLTYHKANLFGLMGGPTPDDNAGVPGLNMPGSGKWSDIQDTSVAERKIFPLLEWLEKSGYPYDFLPLMGSGLYTDNSPPGEQYCNILRQWNDKHGSRILIRTATLAEFFARLEKHAAEFPVHRGEWTDWWSDGVAATPVDTLLYRNAQRTRRVIDLLDPQHEAIAPERLTALDKKLMYYAEHTFGFSNTVVPQLMSHQVFARKSKHAIDADQMACTALFEILRRRGEGEFQDRRPLEYKVINPLNTPVRSIAALPVKNWDAPAINRNCRVVDEKGREYNPQFTKVPGGWSIRVVVSLGAGEVRSFKLLPLLQAAEPRAPEGEMFENAFYRIGWDKGRGIVSLKDLGSGREVLDSSVGSLGCPIYQLFPGADRTKMGHDHPRNEITAGRCTAIRRAALGDVYEQWEFQYQVPGATQYLVLATFFRELPQIELTVRLMKTDVRDPEGMYVLFPFALTGGTWYLDKPGAAIRPGLDQLPQACCDYYCLQHGAAMAGPNCGAVYTTLDAPLVHIGGLKLWRYTTSIEPTGPVYSWLTNNKWDTNFRMSCGGAYDFRYLVQAGREFSDATRGVAQCRDLSYPPIVIRG
jgi:hypothetical protein